MTTVLRARASLSTSSRSAVRTNESVGAGALSGPPSVATPTAAAGAAKPEAPLGTNAWARQTILVRARQIGLGPELASKVGAVGLWYYSRILMRLNRKGAVDQELPPGTNRYLVPISLALACDYTKHPVELDRLLRLSGVPTKRTSEEAHRFYARCAAMMAPAPPAAPVRRPRPTVARAPEGAPAAVARPRPNSAPRARPGPAARPVPARPVPAVAAATRPATTALATQPPDEVVRLRRLIGDARGPGAPASKPRELNTNNWARKRIADLSRSLGIPEPVRNRALQIYERIVDLHSQKAHAPPGKRINLSPRLNWSLVYTTIYLGCRVEEYPKDLPDILGRNPPPGSLREMYRLYRLYKRELGLATKQVDVRTFISSWMDGFDLSELVQEQIVVGEAAWLRSRAVTIATKVRNDASLKNTSTKVIAAGALTTALAERNPPGNLSAFYRAIAGFFYMSEETIRFVVARIANIL